MVDLLLNKYNNANTSFNLVNFENCPDESKLEFSYIRFKIF